MRAELVPENGDRPISITRDVTVVGRREFCDVQINDPSLSKRHCVLVKTDGLLVVRDLATTNGTKVKGQRVRWAALLPDDRLTLGGYKVRVYLGPDDVPGPSERPTPVAKKAPLRKATEQPAPVVKSLKPAPSPAPARAELEFPTPTPTPAPAPSPVSIPTVGGLADLEIVDDASDSGWRHLIASRQRDDENGGPDLVIDLD